MSSVDVTPLGGAGHNDAPPRESNPFSGALPCSTSTHHSLKQLLLSGVSTQYSNSRLTVMPTDYFNNAVSEIEAANEVFRTTRCACSGS